MIDAETFAAGLTRISLAVRQSIDAATFAVYHEALERETNPAEWEAFTLGLAPRLQWFPKLAELLDALREFRGATPLEAEAVEAYERVLQAGAYTAEGGTSWTFRGVRETCGPAAAEAFLEAGGNGAFANTFRESDRRERFVAAYCQAAREEPEARLLPAAPTHEALPAAPLPTEAEAVRIVDRIRELVGEQPARPKPKDGLVVATDERMAQLQRQAALLREMDETLGAGEPLAEEIKAG